MRIGQVSAFASGGWLALVSLVQVTYRDDAWFSAWLLEIPGVVFLAFPTLLLITSFWIRPRGWIVAHGALVGLAIVIFLDPRIAWPRPEKAGHLKVMTYNVEYLLSGMPLVIQTIRSQQPDVVFLQESAILTRPYNPQGELIRSLPEYQAVFDGELLILSRATIRKLSALRMPSQYPHRPILVAQIQWRGQPLTLVNVHMQPNATQALLPRDLPGLPRRTRDVLQIRKSQWAQVCSLLRAIEGPVLFGGDLNGTPKQRFRTQLRRQGLADSFDVAGSGFGFTISSDFPLRRIDAIWSRGLLAESSRAVASRASDHRPVVATFRLPGSLD